MSKLDKMSIEKILDTTGGFFLDYDIVNFTSNAKMIKEYADYYKRVKGDMDKVNDFIISNKEEIFGDEKPEMKQYEENMKKASSNQEKEIEQKRHKEALNKIRHDKIKNIEKFVLTIYSNHECNLQEVDKELKLLEQSKKANQQEISRLIMIKHNETPYLENSRKLLNGTDVYNVMIEDLEGGKLDLSLVSSKEKYLGKKLSGKKTESRIKEIDAEIAEGHTNEDGTEIEGASTYIFQILLLSDLANILPDYAAGMELRDIILRNCIMEEGIYTQEFIESVEKRDFENYKRILDSAPANRYLPKLREELIKNARFIDLDKVLLLCAYRFEEYLEVGLNQNKEDDENFIKDYVEFLQSKIINKKLSINETIQKRETFDEMQINYNYSDIEKFLSRFVDGKYYTRTEISDIKEDILSGKANIEDVNPNIIKILDLSKKEIEDAMNESPDNLIQLIKLGKFAQNDILKILADKEISKELVSYLAMEHKLSEHSFLELYYQGKIKQEFFKEFSEEIDVSSEINLQKIDELYRNIENSQDKDKLEENKLGKQIELYKTLNIDGKDEKELEKYLNEELSTYIEDEEDILFYYKHGLMPLEAVADLGGDNLIEELYNKQQISMQDIEELYAKGKISKEKIEKIVFSDDLKDEQIIEYIKKGYMTDDTLVAICSKARFHERDFQEWYDNKWISSSLFNRLKNISINDLKKESNTFINNPEEIDLHEFYELENNDIDTVSNVVDISMLAGKSKRDLMGREKNENTKTSIAGGGKPRCIINPGARIEFFKALGFYYDENPTMGEHPENSPFKNYRIYVNSLNVEKDTIIIAEPIFKDEERKEGFESGAATYIMRFGDLCVINNHQEIPKGKKEAIAPLERDGVIYRVYHNTKGMMETKEALKYSENPEEVEIKTGSWASNVLKKIAYARAGGKIIPKKVNEELEAYKYLSEAYSDEEILIMLGKMYKSNKKKYKGKTVSSGILEIAKKLGYIEQSETEELAIYNWLRSLYSDDQLRKISKLVDEIDNGILPENNIPGQEEWADFPIGRIDRNDNYIEI